VDGVLVVTVEFGLGEALDDGAAVAADPQGVGTTTPSPPGGRRRLASRRG
jgi:hypothetical protein